MKGKRKDMGQQEKKKTYKDTLNLPKTSFSMKANLPQKEPLLLKKWQEDEIYSKIVSKRKGSDKVFILHDGPPYANGHIHMGHVLNKMLKDICVKFFTMRGFFSPFVPGWDCHGLPVEHQLFKELKMTKHDIDQVDFRKKAYKYAMKYVKIQAEEFKRLGIFGDWENPYLTLTKDYEADILTVLADLCEKGYIYKDLKPVNWCAKCETALAEAEVEYEDKISPSIYIKFKAEEGFNSKETFFIIWTTTPWTLLANVALALHPDFKYVLVDVCGEIWIMAKDLVGPLMAKFGIDKFEILKEMRGEKIADVFKKAVHPFIERESAVVTADYVTKEEGTGCVHIAPGHGQEDYLTGKKYSLPVIMPVNSEGKFTTETGEFAGQKVLDANKAIIEKMKENGTLVKVEDVSHSYPHCWRCKDPIIFRATEQWFVRIDHLDLRKKIADVISKEVEWIPSFGRERIGAMMAVRPDWCLSRQRYWGVPIPAFQCRSCSEAFTTPEIIRKTAELTRKNGADVWFEKDNSEFLAAGFKCRKCGSEDFIKEQDILDVWFDSGVSYKAVLEAREDLRCPADLYLEGSDQHRGWFQSSIITSMAAKEQAPYKKVLTHGFVVDGKGKKMSKSVGNVISPQDIMPKYGADILRLWVASSDYMGDVKLSTEILERLADGYRKMRNTFRFLLSNLYDFDESKDTVDDSNMLSELDRWMLSRLGSLVTDVTGHYEKCEFYKVYRAIYNFCVYEVSAVYLDVVKDVLYVSGAGSFERRSGQTVIFNVLSILLRLVAPILPFTSEEAWQEIRMKDKEKSVHMADWPDTEISGWKDQDLDVKWEKLLHLRNSVMKFLELKREKGLIGSSLEAAVIFCPEEENMAEFVRKNIDLFSVLFKISQAEAVESKDRDKYEFEKVEDMPLSIAVNKAKGEKCQRCWNYSETVGKSEEFLDLCKRCQDVILERSHNG
ncbi:MAG: isoleucine--tRNA ligase [Candidatus Omnitrophota bacterium]